MALLPVSQALARILDGATATGSESVELLDAQGRVLAADLAATLTQPPFDASAMDGYAVRAADVANLPARLRVIGEASAGRRHVGEVDAGEAVRIFTGAPIPRGADAVIIQENTTRDGDGVIVNDGSPDPEHIRPRGMDFTQGQVLLNAGRRLDARALTLAAAMGHATLPVRRRPEVAILGTGDELVLPGTRPGPDQIIACNSFGLAAMARSVGATARVLGLARDTRAAIEERIEAAAGADVLVTTGGASVGDHDLVGPALRARGMALDFWKIAMRPGKPLLFGRLGSQRVLGLPGNPVSALICARVFLVPLIERLLGTPGDSQARQRATLSHPLGRNGPRTHYMRANLNNQTHGNPTVTAAASQDSSLLTPLASANALIVREPEAPAVPAGAEVEVLKLDF